MVQRNLFVRGTVLFDDYILIKNNEFLMNFGDLAQCVEDQNDLEKLVRLCNSYGLNE